MSEKGIKKISILILFAYIFVMVIYTLAYAKGKNDNLEEQIKDVEIFENVVAYVDSIFKDDSFAERYDRYKETKFYVRSVKTLDYMKKCEGLRFADAYVEELSKTKLTHRNSDYVYMRYVDNNDYNFYIRFRYDEESEDSIFDNFGIRIYSNCDDEIIGISNDSEEHEDYVEIKANNKNYLKKIKKIKSKNNESINNCLYEKLSKTRYNPRVLEVGDRANILITNEAMEEIKKHSDYLDYEVNRRHEINKYLIKLSHKTAKNEKKLSTKIKRKVFSLFNENHDELAPDEVGYVGNTIVNHYTNENDEVEGELENINIILESSKEKDGSVFLVDFFQMVILGGAWGLLSKVVPRLFGYKNSSFGEGMIYGAMPFLIAIFQIGVSHAYLEYAFLLGIVPMIKGILLGIAGKKVNENTNI